MKFRGVLSILSGNSGSSKSAVESFGKCIHGPIDDTSSFSSECCLGNCNADHQPYHELKSPRTPSSQPSIANWLQQHVPFSPRFRSQSYNQLLERTLLATPYPLPSDNEQLEVMDQMHFHLKQILHNNYVTKLKKPSSVLDVGTGSGAWLLEMASEFPNTRCVGIDISDVQPRDIIPKNCQFDLGDVLKGLPYSDASFDFVYQRFLEMGVPSDEWPLLLDELRRVCAPGGSVELVVTDNLIHGGGPICKLLNDWHMRVLEKRGVDVAMVENLAGLMVGDSGTTEVDIMRPVDYAVAYANAEADGVNNAVSASAICDMLLSQADKPISRKSSRLNNRSSSGSGGNGNNDGHTRSSSSSTAISLASNNSNHNNDAAHEDDTKSEYASTIFEQTEYRNARFEQVTCLRLRFTLNPKDGVHSQQALRVRQALVQGYQASVEHLGVTAEQLAWAVKALEEEVAAFDASIDVLIITGRKPA
ncbi:S-adenosyl-L-methionine-dependent methyltransferase [Syncephalis fuscata]|nr:S-adenosyl-L-methionine-dependent methyltransferase [Syncephalis fuscata]